MLKKTGLIVVLLGFLSLLGLSTAYARAAKPLLNPGPTAWGCTLSLSEVKKGIDTGLFVREWTSSNAKTGYVQGKVVVRGKHTLVVDINYTESSFEIKYKSSDNLKHSINSSGVEKIHPNANSWMDNLNSSIVAALKSECSQ